MQGIFNSVSAVLIILLMMSIGYIFGKAGWMKAEHKSLIVKFLINAAVPGMCLSNTFKNFSLEMLSGAGRLLLVPSLHMTVMIAVSVLVAKLAGVSRKRFGGFAVMCGFSNAIFVGLPICTELFGSAGTSFVMFFYLVNTIFFWLVGSPLIYRSGEGGHKPTIGESLRHLASPPLIALVVSLALLLLGFEPPHLVLSLAGYLGNAVTPLALLYIGFILYESGIKNIRVDKDMAVMLAMRFLASPLVMLGLCAIFSVSGTARGVFTVQSAMPVMTQSVIISGLAGADEEYNAAGMSLTTLACLAVVPVIMLIV